MNKLVIALLLLSLFACASKKYDPAPMRNGSSDKFMTYLLAKDYTLASKMFSKKLLQDVPASKLKKAWSKQLKQLGTPISFTRVNQDKDTDFIKVTFKNHELPLHLHYTKGVIEGIWFRKEHRLRPRSVQIESFDKAQLTTVISAPKIAAERVKKVVLFVHGSGPNDMDESPGRLFNSISNALLAKKIATLRYNKRTYEMKKRRDFGEDISKLKTKGFDDNFLNYFIKDAESMVEEAKRRFPNAKVVLFGHSQGTFISLQIAKTNPNVGGLVLLGSYQEKINATILEQRFYRQLTRFHSLDKNRDGKLTKREYGKNKNLSSQMKMIDLNRDGRLSLSEYKAAQYTQLLRKDKTLDSWLRQEMLYPTPVEIIRSLKMNTLFVHGKLDNQTPIHFPLALKLLNGNMWKKSNLNFKFYEGVGHSLNPQKKYLEFNHNRAPKNIIENLAREIESI